MFIEYSKCMRHFKSLHSIKMPNFKFRSENSSFSENCGLACMRFIHTKLNIENSHLQYPQRQQKKTPIYLRIKSNLWHLPCTHIETGELMYAARIVFVLNCLLASGRIFGWFYFYFSVYLPPHHFFRNCTLFSKTSQCFILLCCCFYHYLCTPAVGHFNNALLFFLAVYMLYCMLNNV